MTVVIQEIMQEKIYLDLTGKLRTVEPTGKGAREQWRKPSILPQPGRLRPDFSTSIGILCLEFLQGPGSPPVDQRVVGALS